MPGTLSGCFRGFVITGIGAGVIDSLFIGLQGVFALPLVFWERGEHDVDLLAHELGLIVGVPHAFKLGERLFHQLKTDLRVRHLATAEFQAELHLVTMRKEFLGVADLR